MAPHSGIRKMTADDCSFVQEIDTKVSVDPWSEKLYSDCIGVGYDCWVMTEDKIVIGFGIMSYASNEAHILNIVIIPEKQGQGLGEHMLQHLLTLARQHDSDEVFLEVRASNEAAKNLYQKHHFVEVGIRKEYYPAEDGGDQNEDAITFGLSLW